MSNGFFKELEDMLDNEFISLKDSCALFAGFCPLEKYNGSFGSPDVKRRYKRISDGEEVKPSKADFHQMEQFAGKYSLSGADIRANQKNPNVTDANDAIISVRWAFKMGLGFRPLDERICALYDAAVDEGLLPIEPSVRTEEVINNLERPPKLSQSPLQDNLIQLAKLESGLTAGILFERWEKVKPYYIVEIIPAKNNSQKTYIDYKFKHITHSKKVVIADYDQLEKAIKRAYDFNKKSSK